MIWRYNIVLGMIWRYTIVLGMIWRYNIVLGMIWRYNIVLGMIWRYNIAHWQQTTITHMFICSHSFYKLFLLSNLLN
jgi:hypothetical protein